MIDLNMLGLKAFEPDDPFSLAGMNGNFKVIDELLKELTTNKWDGKNRWRTYQWGINQSEGSFGYSTADNGNNGYYNMQYADSYSLGNDGVLSLVNPVSVTKQTGVPPVGKYIKVQVVEMWGTPKEWSTVMYVTDQVKSSSHSWTGDGGATVITDISITGLTALTTYERFSGMVGSESADTFPADGWVGGTHYVKAPAATVLRPTVEYGSYVGTGLCGSNNPTVLNFAIKPYLVLVQATNCSLGKPANSSSEFGNMGNQGLFLRGTTQVFLEKFYNTGEFGHYYTEDVLLLTWGDYSVSMYAIYRDCDSATTTGSTGDAVDQLNDKGVTYRYLAIGLAE